MGFSPRHWRVRSKLTAVLVVPALAFLVLASLNMGASIRGARDFGQGATIAEFGQQVTRLVHELQAERDISAGYIGTRRPPNSADPAAPKNQLKLQDTVNKALGRQQTSVNDALAAYRTAQDAVTPDLDSAAQAKVDRARTALDDLSPLRAAVARALLTGSAALDQYTGIITRLLDIDVEIGQGGSNAELTQSVTALNDLGRAKEAVSQVRGRLYAIAFAGTYEFGEFQKLSGLIAEQNAAVARFRADANDSQRTLFDEQVNGQAVLTVRRIQDTAVNRQQAIELDVDPEQWYAASTTRIELIRSVESRVLDSVVGQARTLRSDAQRSAITTGVVILAILLIALLTSLLIARSMIKPLRKLRSSALDVAENRLPQAIQRLRGTDGDTAEIEVKSIGLDSRDEIGEVAQTFDAIHEVAIRLATEQAALRANVNSMFVNLSRRSQGLVERQLKLIDELETGEQDPDQLSNLFKLDHLATRMRRNSENLLVLAGEDAGRRWGRPIPLVDVLRAATSEVEQYHRIQLTGVPDVEVMGHAVNHVVHLVAELLENATVFSSPESKVLVHSQRLSDGGSMIEIEDRGIGMTAQEIGDANERLARPPVFDVSISRMMGLFVVGRLAGRHGITVRLRQSELGGVSAFVRLPADVLANRYDQRNEPPLTSPPPLNAEATRLAGRPNSQPMLPPAQPAGQPMLPAGQQPGRPGPAADLPRRPLPPPGAMPGAPGRTSPPGSPVPGGHGGPPMPAPTGNNVEPPRQGGSPPLPRRTPGAGPDQPPDGVGGIPGAIPGGVGPGGHPGIPGGGGPGGLPRRPVFPAAGAPTGGPGGPGSQNGPGAPGMGAGGPRQQTPPPMPDGRPAPPPVNALTSSIQQAPGRAGEEIRLPIFEQLQSEWFRRRTPTGRSTAPPGRQQPPPTARSAPPTAPPPAQPRVAPPRAAQPPAPPPAAAPPVGPPPLPQRPAAQYPAAQFRSAQQPPAPPAPAPAGPPAGAEPDTWQSPADEGWRAAERLLAPTTGGTTRAGLPMRVPQAHLMPGAAETPPVPAPVQSPAARSPEAVRSRLASYHQGVRRGRHADRRGDDNDQPEVLVQSQEQT